MKELKALWWFLHHKETKFWATFLLIAWMFIAFVMMFRNAVQQADYDSPQDQTQGTEEAPQ
jgi:hypothetical protein